MKAEAAKVQELTTRLTTCTDEERNVSNLAGALDVISNLESISMTKGILEDTRIGLLINDIRKKSASTHPELSQKCRGLIKAWQLLTKPPGTGSGNSSRGGTPMTPMGVSPAVRNRLTTPNPGASKKPISPLVTSVGVVKSRPVTPASSIRSTNTTPSPGQATRTNGACPSGSSPSVFSSSYAPSGEPNKLLTTVKSSESLCSSNGSGGIKLKIKIGSETGSGTTTFVRTISPQESSSDVSKEQAENRRKRKLPEEPTENGVDTADGGKFGGKIRESMAVESVGTVVNGVSPPEIFVDTEPQRKRARGSTTKNKQQPSPTEPVPQVPLLPGKATKLKSTMEYLDSINEGLPENMAITIEKPKPVTETLYLSESKVSECDGLDSTRESTDFSECEEMELKRKRGRPRKDGMNYYYAPVEHGKQKRKKDGIRRTASTEDIKRGKSVLVQKLLDSTPSSEAVYEEDQIPETSGFSHGLSYKSSPALVNLERASYSKDSPDFGEGSAEPGGGSDQKTDNSGKNPQVAWKKARKKANDWYECLPSLNLDILKEVCLLNQEEFVRETGQSIAEDRVELEKINDLCTSWRSTESKDSTLHTAKDSRSRFLRSERNREVLGMPYVDIGIPDFVEYKFPDQERYLSDLNFVFRPRPGVKTGSSIKSGVATPLSSKIFVNKTRN